MPSVFGANPGTPDWYAKKLATDILNRQARYDKLERYVLGDHDLPDLDRKYVKALKSFQERAKTNYYGMVTVAPVERMRVVGFRFGETDGEADQDASLMWAANDMDFVSKLVHFSAATFGDSYVLVSPPDSSGYPIFTPEDPRYCAVHMNPNRPTKAAAGFRMWQDEIAQHVVGVLYLPDGYYYYVGPPSEDVMNQPTTAITNRLFNASDGLRLVHYEPNPAGEVPLVRFAWRPTYTDFSRAEAEDVITIQDRINSEILNRMIISRSQAYKQRMISGVKIPSDQGNNRKPPFDPAADALWVVENPEAKPFEFREADIRQILEAIRDDVGDMAAITKTPPHYLLGEVVNVSGDALKAAETGLVSKTMERMLPMGWSWRNVVRLGFKYIGNAKATEVVSETIWADPESKSRAELADAMIKERQAGVPLQLAMERANFTPKQIEFAVAEQKREMMRQAALQAAVNGSQNASKPRTNSNGMSGGAN